MKKTNDRDSKSTKNSSGQCQHNTTPIETNNDIALDKHLDNINITQPKISKTITSNEYHHKKLKSLKQMIQNYKNKHKILTNQERIIQEILQKYLKKQHRVLNQLKILQNKKNDNTSRNKIKFETNNISNKIQNNIQTTIDHVYIPNFKKLKENVIEQIEKQNNTNVNHIQTTNTTNHPTVESNNIKTIYHNL